MQRGRHAVLLALLASACGAAPDAARSDSPTGTPGTLPSLGLTELSGAGFTIQHPADASVGALPLPAGAIGAVAIHGPPTRLRSARGDGLYEAPAYGLEVVTWPNPERLDAAAWYARARDGATETVRGTTRVAGHEALHTERFGGDSQWVDLYVPAGEWVLALRYNRTDAQNDPAAEVREAVHLLMISTLRPAGGIPGPAHAGDAADATAAAEAAAVARRFYALLSERRFAHATALYAGDLSPLTGWNPDVAATDTAELLRRGCEQNGLVCMPLADVQSALESAGGYALRVSFRAPDGGVFRRGPCCGEPPDAAPPESIFTVVVARSRGGWGVRTLPPYVP